jgi:hypothetical protein
LLSLGALSHERTCRSFTIAAGLASAVTFGSESRRTRGHILLSQIRDFPFRRLLRLPGSRWRYSTPPPHGCGVPNRGHRVEQFSYPLSESDIPVVQEASVYVAVRTLLIEPLAGNGRLASTLIFQLSGRVYRALLNIWLFQLVVPDTCINRPLPVKGIHM